MHKIIHEDMQYIHSNLKELSRDLYGKTILITGASGMLASYCVHYLMFLNINFHASIKVYAMVRNSDAACKLFTEYADNSDFQILCQDVCEPIKHDIDKADFVIHAASKASPIYYGRLPVETITANVIGTFNLLEWCRIHNPLTNFVYFSSDTIYGDTKGIDHPINESDCGTQNNLTYRACYSESKRLGETLCFAYSKEYNINTKIIRLGHTFGPTVSLNDGRVFADFTQNIVENKDICLMSDGTAQRCFCYIADTVDGIFRILLMGQSGEAYNLMNTNNFISIADLAELLVKLYPEKKLKVVRKFRNIDNEKEYAQEEKFQKSTYSIEKIASLGWQPKINIEESFKRTIEYFIQE